MYVGDVYEDDVYLVIPWGGGLYTKREKAESDDKARPKGVNLTLTPFVDDVYSSSSSSSFDDDDDDE